MHKKVDIADTAMLEYLEIFKMEYEREFNKKQSFDNRAGLILTLLGAISIFLFENIKINEIITLIKFPISFLNIIKAFSGLTVYVAFIYTVIKSIATIIVKPQNQYAIKNINNKRLKEEKIVAIKRMISTYEKIIIQHREVNLKRAISFTEALYGMGITLIAIIVYIAFS